MNGYPGNFELVDPATIVIDHRYQRPEKANLINLIAENFSWEAFGVPTCFKRSNGMLYAADGQQRVRAVLAMSNTAKPKLVPVIWFKMEDLEDEASVFVKINEWRKQLQAMEKYKGKLVAKDPAALGIERAVEKAGFTVGWSNSEHDPRTIVAIGSLSVVYNQLGEDGIVQVLTVHREAWPESMPTVHLIRGIANLIEEYGDDYNRAKVVTGLRKTAPDQILRKAEALRFDTGGSKITNVRRAIKQLAKV